MNKRGIFSLIHTECLDFREECTECDGDSMEYLRIQEGCLISILIPLNFAVGEYALWFKLNGYIKHKRIIDCLLFIIGIITTLCLVKRQIGSYIPFIFMGGIVVAIVQSSIWVRNRRKESISNGFESTFEYSKAVIGIIIGIIIIVIPYSEMFYKYILSECIQEVIIICHIIFWMWGIEKVLFNVINIIKLKSAKKK